MDEDAERTSINLSRYSLQLLELFDAQLFHPVHLPPVFRAAGSRPQGARANTLGAVADVDYDA